MKRFHVITAVGFAVTLSLTSAARAQSPAGAALRLRIDPAPPGSSSSIFFAAPYPAESVRIYALSPSGEAFQVESLETDATAKGEAALLLRGDPALGGQNGVFYAELDGPGGRTLRSGAVGLRFPVAGEPLIESPEFIFDEAPAAPGLALGVALLVDIDADGDVDVLGTDFVSGGTLRVLMNDGAGAFTDETSTRSSLQGVTGIRFLVSADLNGDGTNDLFAGTESTVEANFVFLNDAGLFRAGTPVSKGASGVRSNDAVLADLDADGDVDLFVVNGITGSHGAPATPQPNSLFLNDGNGNFTMVEASADSGLEATVSRSVDAGDVDGDGDLDLIVGNAGANYLLLNDGKAAFTNGSAHLPEAADSTYAVALVDVDLDEDLDIVLAGSMFDPLAQVLVINQGGAQGGVEGDFAAAEFPELVSGQSPLRLGLEVVDVDADGDPDLIFATHELGNNEAPDLYLNQGGAQQGEAGTFVRTTNFPAPTGVYTTVPAGDADGDGDLDFLVLGSETRLLRSQVFASGNPPLAFRRGDVNQDGAHDLSDPIAILGHLFLGAPAPACALSADVNDSGVVDLSDAIALLGHLFLATSPPPAPFPELGDPASRPKGSCQRVAVFQVPTP